MDLKLGDTDGADVTPQKPGFHLCEAAVAADRPYQSEDLLARATKDGDGLKWIQAENRVQPNLLVAQTGLMQGATGIGLWLLHMDEYDHGKKPLVILPDSPF